MGFCREKFFVLFIQILTLSSVKGQEIFTSPVDEGSSLTLTCNEKVAGYNGLPLGDSLKTLTLSKDGGTIAAFSPPFKDDNEYRRIFNNPDTVSFSRWTARFFESDQSTLGIYEIKVDINQVQCTDSGQYMCMLSYIETGGTTQDKEINEHKNMTVRAPVENLVMIKVPDYSPSNNPHYSEYVEGTNITLSCLIDGPKAVSIVWKKYNTIFARWDMVTENIDPKEPSLKPGSTCNQHSHESVITLPPLEKNMLSDITRLEYKCDAVLGDKTYSENFTIAIVDKNGNPGPSQAGGGSDDVPMIVGIVIGVLALIVIVIVLVYFLVIRRRRKDSDDKPAAEDNNPNNLHAPPPVFYSKPHKPPKDERDTGLHPQTPKGMTNEGLDTSYDSKESANRAAERDRYANVGGGAPDSNGPPRYEKDPHYVKESHRGRHNRAYDDEDKDRNGGYRRSQPREDAHDRPRERPDSRSRDNREEPARERDDRGSRRPYYDPRDTHQRHHSNDDGTDDGGYAVQGMGDPSIGTAI